MKTLLILFVLAAAAFAPAQETPAPSAPEPDSAATRAALLMDAAVQYADEGEFGEAEQAYLRALEHDPGNQTIRFRLGTLYIQMGAYEKAIPVLEELLREMPENPILLNNLAWVYATGGTMKDGAKAMRYAREAILSFPADPSAWNTLAEAHYMAGQYDRALKASEYAFDLLSAQEGITEEQLAPFRQQYLKIQRAAESYKTLLNIDPDDDE